MQQMSLLNCVWLKPWSKYLSPVICGILYAMPFASFSFLVCIYYAAQLFYFSLLTVYLWCCMQNPCLVLTGPVRAVMAYGLVIFEASLYVKGATMSDDKELSLLATSVGPNPTLESCLFQRSYTSRLSTLKLMLGHLTDSMEATIRVRVASGTWPDGFGGRFAVRAGSMKQHLVLLDSGDKKVSLTGNEIRLARQVVSVETHRKLVVFVAAKNGSVVYRDVKDFKPLEMGTSSKELLIGSCMLEVTVYWSRF